jgi:acetylornithine deacetylase/succinyl-diaminopimelate desuccinylase-like protein
MDPQLASRLIHSANERIALDDLELAVDCFRHTAVQVTGG